MTDTDASRWSRIRALVGVGLQRVAGKATETDTRRVMLSLGGVALAIALMLIVTGIALGLASGSTIDGGGADYWIVPEAGSSSTLVVAPDAPQFGEVHPTNDRIHAIDGVVHASPVLVEMNRLRTAEGHSEYVLLLGVIPREGFEVEGIATDSLKEGDPYYQGGKTEWTGEIVLSSGAAQLLNVSPGASVHPVGAAKNRSLTVVNVSTGTSSSGVGQVPIGVLHLSELQALTGSDTGDQADQFLVTASSPAVESELASIYPRSTVLTESGLTTQSMSQDLPLALSLASLLVAIVVGTLFIGTTMGLEITADRQAHAVMGAIGLPFASRAIIVTTQTLVVTFLGGLVGIMVGVGGIAVTNELAMATLTSQPIASFHPVLVGYGVVVAVLIGFLTAPYLLWLTSRTNIIAELGR